MLLGQHQLLVEHDDTVGTAQYEVAVSAQHARIGVEVLAFKPLLLGPVAERPLVQAEGGEPLLRTEQQALTAIVQNGIDVVRKQGGVFLVEVLERLLAWVVYNQTAVAGTDVQQSVGRLEERIDVARGDGQVDVPVLAALFLQQEEAGGRTYPHRGGIFLQDGGDAAQTWEIADVLVPVVNPFQVVVASRPYVALRILDDGADVFVGSHVQRIEERGREVVHGELPFVNLVDARAVTSGPDDAGTDLAERDENVVLAVAGGVERAEERVPPLRAAFVEADAVVGGHPQVAVGILDDSIHLIVDKRLPVADGMFQPAVLRVAVVAHRHADGVVGHPDALFLVHVDVADGITVHGIGATVVGYDVGDGLVVLCLHFVDTGSLGSNQNLVGTESVDAVDADIHQVGAYLLQLVGGKLINVHPPLERADEYLVGREVVVELVDLQVQTV